MNENQGLTPVAELPKEIAAVAKPAPANLPKFFSFVPANLTELMKYGDMVAASDFVPKDYKGKPGNCVIGMQYGAELGLPPLQALQNIAVINGKPGVYGDLGKALLYSKGFKIEERDAKEVQAKEEAWCKVTRPDGSTTERTFSKAMAVAANLWGNNTWKSYPYRMMAWRAFWWAARDGAADVLKGIWGVEELQDYKRDAIDTNTVASDDSPKEIQTPAAEPTPGTPVVDVAPVNYINTDERKELVALLNKHNVNPEMLRDYLHDRLGITEEKKPTAFIPKERLQEIRKWVIEGQDELGV